ncbi:MAG: hypothetical protein HYU70_02035 [Bacteroidetes bacterium]|nr:hypothetical protein [Bacteroidota bacterium]
MPSKYLYIDDENDGTTRAIAIGLELSDRLRVELSEPQELKKQKEFFQKNLPQYDGIILDLRLDGRRLDIPYNAPALAAELRMMAAEGTISCMPIILCSTEEKMRATYDIDRSSHDQFDYKFQKQESPPWEKFSRKLDSLALGYKEINKSGFTWPELLGRKDLSVLDKGIFEQFADPEKRLPVFSYASFIIKELFHHPGLLIKEMLLAARLGIDIQASHDAWPKLLHDFLGSAKYSGIFSDGWDRWWSDLVIGLFNTQTQQRLSMLDAEQRVAAITDLTGIKGLVAAAPIERNISASYWTVCEFYKKPLDPLEGFKIHSSIEPKSWQEYKYISLDAVLRKKGPKPHSTELDRIEFIKETINKS